jgi:hypothetical protein
MFFIMKCSAILTVALLLSAASAQAQQLAIPLDSTPSAPAPDPTKGLTPTPVSEATPPTEFSCRVLTGRVTDPFAYPLIGATVMLRSPDKTFKTDAFTTNAEGQYMLTSKKPIFRNLILEITAAGYTSVELPLTNCQPLDVTLEPLPGTRFKSDGRIKRTRMSGKIR